MTENDPLCPRCKSVLKPEQVDAGVFWRCHACKGCAAGVTLLRQMFTPESINPLWIRAIEDKGEPGCSCPSCRNRMTEVALSDKSRVNVDVCRVCQFVWFDVRETDSLAALPPQPRQALPEAAAEVVGMARVKQIAWETGHGTVAERWAAIARCLVQLNWW